MNNPREAQGPSLDPRPRRARDARRARRHVLALLAWLTVALLLPATLAQDLASRVHTATLDNGLRILLVEQHAAPVVSFDLMFDVGGVDEPPGLGGIAHMVEHMAFKGTETIGTDHPQQEQQALTNVEILAYALKNAQSQGDAALVATLQKEFMAARKDAQSLASQAPLDSILSVNGAVGLNASTGYDYTHYVVSLPANRLELYARIYADEMAHAVFRSFYEERDVVREERRQRSEDDPQGVLMEAFLAEAFPASPYGRPLIGSASAIEGYTATQAHAFYQAFYAPDRAVLVVVGDVDPVKDLATLERYFGAVPAHPTLTTRFATPPAQTAERRTTVTFKAQPQVMIGYPKATYPSREAYVLDLVDALLGQGRTSRLYKRLVVQDQLAASVQTSSSFPGTRLPDAFIIYALPRAPHTTAEVEAAVYDELHKLATEPVGDRELQKVKNLVRALTLRTWSSNAGLAQALAYNELFAGGWEHLMSDLDTYDSVTAAEIQAVAQKVFTAQNRTVAVLEPPQGGN
ncbi:MAG: pitrilysin family protein [Deinococcales bacterium]